jgi:hypothetical protein
MKFSWPLLIFCFGIAGTVNVFPSGSTDSPSLEAAQTLTTRSFLAPPNFFTHQLVSRSAAPLGINRAIEQELCRRGIQFPPGASVVLLRDSSKLIVRNSPEQLDRLMDLFEQMASEPSSNLAH